MRKRREGLRESCEATPHSLQEHINAVLGFNTCRKLGQAECPETEKELRERAGEALRAAARRAEASKGGFWVFASQELKLRAPCKARQLTLQLKEIEDVSLSLTCKGSLQVSSLDFFCKGL